ncbi:hypothetical protein M0Q97_08745 [Candidatus Dojkabacteria bacterium]|jgi:hypothetical protein|nr:hypothetical protein [Candidatus Dojkabacteria bacterium]
MSKKSGFLVKTKTDKRGRTYHKLKLINNKTVVYLVDDNNVETGTKILCDPKSLKIIGFLD